MTIQSLTQDHEAAAKALMDGIKELIPVGTKLRILMRGRGGKTIDAEVISHGHAWSIKYPHEVHVKNLKTGKTRTIDVHPEFGHRYEVIG